MNLSDLPVEDQELVLALIEIASTDCRGHAWNDLEPILRKCWGETRRTAPAHDWNEVAPYVRAACEDAVTAARSDPADSDSQADAA